VHPELSEAWDGYPLLGTQELKPGESRESVGFVFASVEAAAKLRAAGKFYLWDGRFIGEAIVID
jgi:hypothetical protein